VRVVDGHDSVMQVTTQYCCRSHGGGKHVGLDFPATAHLSQANPGLNNTDPDAPKKGLDPQVNANSDSPVIS
jgi:hypothetical protein